MTAMTVIALGVVAGLGIVGVRVIAAILRARREDRRDRERSQAASVLVRDIRASARAVDAARHAQDVAATDRAGYIQRPNWGPNPAFPRLPEEDQ